MTTRAFLKTAEKKRDSSQAKEPTPITPITPIDPKPSATQAPSEKPQEGTIDGAPADASAPLQETGQAVELGAPSADQGAAPTVEEGKEAQSSIEGEVRYSIILFC